MSLRPRTAHWIPTLLLAIVACNSSSSDSNPCCTSNGQPVAQGINCPKFHGALLQETVSADFVASLGSTVVSGSAWGTGSLETASSLTTLVFDFWNGKAGGEGMNQIGLGCMGTTATALNAAHTLKDACSGGAYLTIIDSDALNTLGRSEDLTSLPTSLSAQAKLDASGNGTLSIRIDVPQFTFEGTSMQASVSNLEATVTFGDQREGCQPVGVAPW